MIARGEDKTDWALVDTKTDEQIAADIASDPAWDGIPDDFMETWTITSVSGLDWPLSRRAHANPVPHRGNNDPVPHRGNKKQITMRFDPEVLDYFRGQGRGWQSRMNAAPRGFMLGDISRSNRKSGQAPDHG